MRSLSRSLAPAASRTAIRLRYDRETCTDYGETSWYCSRTAVIAVTSQYTAVKPREPAQKHDGAGSHSGNSHPATPASTNAAYTPALPAVSVHISVYARAERTHASAPPATRVTSSRGPSRACRRRPRVRALGACRPPRDLFPAAGPFVCAPRLCSTRASASAVCSARFLLYQRETRYGVAPWLQLSNTKPLEGGAGLGRLAVGCGQNCPDLGVQRRT
jgi:hypothetical protein